MMANTSEVKPKTRATRPKKSTDGIVLSINSSRQDGKNTKITNATIGRLIQKIQRQENASVKKPPTNGPNRIQFGVKSFVD